MLNIKRRAYLQEVLLQRLTMQEAVLKAEGTQFQALHACLSFSRCVFVVTSLPQPLHRSPCRGVALRPSSYSFRACCRCASANPPAKPCCRSRLWYGWCCMKNRKTLPPLGSLLLKHKTKDMNILTSIKHVVWAFSSHLGKRVFLNEELARGLKDRLSEVLINSCQAWKAAEKEWKCWCETEWFEAAVKGQIEMWVILLITGGV